MYRMDYRIRIGGEIIPLMSSVRITKDVTKLTDTATIVCPAVVNGRPLSFAGKVERWMPVSIELGYNGDLRKEFDGYVDRATIADGRIKIECADALILFKRVRIPDGEMKSPRLKDVVSRVVGEVNKENTENPIKVNCEYDYGYDKYTFSNCTSYDVMEKIQKECNPNIYIKDGTLNIVPPYTNSEGTAIYSMQDNIRKDGLKLKWKEEKDNPTKVVVTATGKDGSEVKGTYGDSGGNELKMSMKGKMSQDDVDKIAENIYRQKVYTGYEGSFGAWLIPFCDAGYTVEVRDKSEVIRGGRYWVSRVEVEMSSSGASRQVYIGCALRGA